jgi:O-antigen ligase
MNFAHNRPVSTSTADPTGSPGAGAGNDGGLGEGVLAFLVLANLWWTALCLGGCRPETKVIADAVNAATFGAWLVMQVGRRRRLELRGAALATIPFLIFGAWSAGWWTPVPWLGWQDWLHWARMAAVFWIVVHGIRAARVQEAMFWGLAALGVLATGMAVYQQVADPAWLMMGRRQAGQFIGRSSGFLGIPNSLAALLNLLLPPMLALTFQRGAGAVQRVLCAYLAAVFAGGILLTISRGAWLSLGLALAVWPMLAFRDRARRWRWSLAVAVLLAAAVAVLYCNIETVRARVDSLMTNRGETTRAIMWRAGWKLVREQPWLGTGAGSYGVLFERYRPGRFWYQPQWAHNDYLNTLSDYGVVGFLLSFGVAVLFVRSWREPFLRKPGSGAVAGSSGRMRAIRAGLVIGLLAFALQLLVDFNLKIPALAQLAAILAALLIQPAAAGTRRRLVVLESVPWLVGAVAAVLVVIAIPCRLIPFWRAEALRYRAQEGIEHLIRHPAADPTRLLATARDRLAKAVDLDPRNGQAWADLAETLTLEARYDQTRAVVLGQEAEAAATRALGCSQVVPEFWVRRALAFDLQRRWRDAWADFVQALALAPKRADLWYYYAYHLSDHDPESARTALGICLTLDPWNQAALALQKRLEDNAP